MNLLPEYSQNIVVAVIADNQFRWFITEKEVWFLNSVSFAKAFSMEATIEEQKMVTYLSEGDSMDFISSIAEFETEYDDLREWILMSEQGSDVWQDSLPSLIVNFDDMTLINYFPEPSGKFHEFLPENWTGKYVGNFEELEKIIPLANRYWNK